MSHSFFWESDRPKPAKPYPRWLVATGAGIVLGIAIALVAGIDLLISQ